uniref:Immunoglobulin V-set domain-containing protein n=1 Tax=Sinocyclocheilus rhinocerous TaxID=307959 RepID=A0A673IBH8_9TELE
RRFRHHLFYGGVKCSELCVSLFSGFSVEISLFVQTGASVQLDIQQLPEFDLLSWMNDKSESIVRYNSDSKRVTPHGSYKDRVDFNDTTFSLTLKNMQKTDSGLYTANPNLLWFILHVCAPYCVCRCGSDSVCWFDSLLLLQE